jgi:hypothetical protein
MYNLESKIQFGQYRGLSIIEIAKKDPGYIQWCIINVDKFITSFETIKELKAEVENFDLSDEAYSTISAKRISSIMNKQLKSDNLYPNCPIPLDDYKFYEEDFGTISVLYLNYIDHILYGTPLVSYLDDDNYEDIIESDVEDYDKLIFDAYMDAEDVDYYSWKESSDSTNLSDIFNT